MKNVTVFAPGSVAYRGEIINQTETHVDFRYKKPRSSKYILESFPIGKVLAVITGNADNPDEIFVASARVAVASFFGNVDSVDGAIVVTNEDGLEMSFGPGADVEIFAEEDDAPAGKAGKGAKAAKADKPAKAGKKVEADDADEEKPAKSAKKDKAEKPGKAEKPAKADKAEKKGAKEEW